MFQNIPDFSENNVSAELLYYDRAGTSTRGIPKEIFAWSVNKVDFMKQHCWIAVPQATFWSEDNKNSRWARDQVCREGDPTVHSRFAGRDYPGTCVRPFLNSRYQYLSLMASSTKTSVNCQWIWAALLPLRWNTDYRTHFRNWRDYLLLQALLSCLYYYLYYLPVVVSRTTRARCWCKFVITTANRFLKAKGGGYFCNAPRITVLTLKLPPISFLWICNLKIHIWQIPKKIAHKHEVS